MSSVLQMFARRHASLLKKHTAIITSLHGTDGCTDFQQQICRTLFNYSAKKGLNRDVIAKLQQPLDWVSLKRKWEKSQADEDVLDQRFRSERHKVLGPDLATAHFIIKRGGKVKFVGSDKWYKQEGKEKEIMLPNVFHPGFKVEAVDASHSNLMYEGLDNFINLYHLKYINLSNCKHIDDWCVSKLQTTVQDSLQSLDLSGCSQITYRGLATLYHLPHLRRLRIDNMPSIPNIQLLRVVLEDMMPNCWIEGSDYDNAKTLLKAVQKEADDMHKETETVLIDSHSAYQKI